jgi:hypothetical protein
MILLFSKNIFIIMVILTFTNQLQILDQSTQSVIPNNEMDSYNYVNSDSFTPPNYDEPALNTSIFDKAEEIMEVVDQVNNLAKDVLNEYQIKQFTMGLLSPYYTNTPHPKAAVEKI